MKQIPFLFLCLIFSIVARQLFASESSRSSILSDTIPLSYSPTNIIYSFSYCLTASPDGRQIIQIMFNTRPKTISSIRIDSIQLKAEKNKTLLLGSPLSDTTFYLKDGSLYFSTTKWIDSESLEFLKHQEIETIIIPTNNSRISLALSRKSQKKLKQMANL